MTNNTSQAMKNIILDFPKQFEEGLEKTLDLKIEGTFNKLLICGMGSSALPANILTTFINDLKTPLFIHQSYGLPPQADENTLIIVISYSGNTEEAISSVEEAIRNGFKAVVVTTGGKIKDLSQEHKLPIVLIPSATLQSRFSLGYLFAALVGILTNSGLIENKSKEIYSLAGGIKPLLFEKTGNILAKTLIGKIPIIYSSYRFKNLAKIWKIKFNETSKIMAFWNYFPELNHNEIAGLSNPQANFHFIIIRDITDSFNIQKRMQITADLILEQRMTYDFADLKGKNILERIVQGLILGDWIAYYLALLSGQDPDRIEIVEEFKRRLAD